jgi:hypothetical protein
MGFPSQFADSAMLRSGNHPFVYYVLIGVACGVLTVRFRHLCPQSLGTRAAAIPDVERNHLAGGGIHGDPYPLLMGFRLDKAGHLIGFHRTGCEFSVTPKLFAWAKVEGNSVMRERYGQKNGGTPWPRRGQECA